jgi:hypothetical protein
MGILDRLKQSAAAKADEDAKHPLAYGRPSYHPKHVAIATRLELSAEEQARS